MGLDLLETPGTASDRLNSLALGRSSDNGRFLMEDVGNKRSVTVLVLMTFQLVGGCSDSSERSQVPSSGAETGTASCAAQTDLFIRDCGIDPAEREFWIEDCERMRNDYAPMGCLGALDAWIACTTTSGYDCKADTGCEQPRSGYFSCESQFVSQTGCTRLGSRDAELCSGQTPYAFACLSMLPAGCVPASVGGSITCCPSFG
jgi:hypothetical protein